MLSNLPRITKLLLIANLIGFGLQWALGDERLVALMLWPLGSDVYSAAGTAPAFMPWQLLSYGFLHGSFMHLA
ncbi:MAG: DUF1751 domain-containing protein, partial [Thermomonas sp.]